MRSEEIGGQAGSWFFFCSPTYKGYFILKTHSRNMLFWSLAIASCCPSRTAICAPSTANTAQGYVYNIANEIGIAAYRIRANGTLLRIPFDAYIGQYTYSICFAPEPRCLYVAGFVGNHAQGGGLIFGLQIGANGALTSLESVTAGSMPTEMTEAVSGSHRFLYCLSAENAIGNGVVYQYKISPSGQLIPLSPAYVHLKSKMLVSIESIANRGVYFGTDNSIIHVPLLKNGSLDVSKQEVLPTHAKAASVLVDPRGRYLYSASDSDDTIQQFRVHADGSLTPGAPARVHTCKRPFSLILDRVHNIVYVCSERGQSIWRHRIKSDGSLGDGIRASGARVYGSQYMTVSSSGKFMYATDWDGVGEGTVSQYRIGAKGNLFPLSPRDINTDPHPLGIVAVPPDVWHPRVHPSSVRGRTR